MIGEITPAHHAQLLKMNREFVHWLSPMDDAELRYVLGRAAYARQINDAAGVLIGYSHDVDYPDHWNMTWLSARLCDYFYIDRIIIDRAAQGTGLGQRLYADVEKFACAQGHRWLACEVNSVPDNQVSRKFHQKLGFIALGEQVFTDNKSVQYFAKALN